MVFNRDMLDHRIIDNIKIQDNFLDKNFFNNFKKILFGSDIDWYKTTVLPKNYDETCDGLSDDLKKSLIISKCDSKHNVQLVHMFYSDDSPNSVYYHDYIKPIVKIMKVRSLIRIKANLNLITEKNIKGGYHVDNIHDESFTSILYFNTCNGWTEFMEGPKVRTIENRLVTFPTCYYHSGVTCTDQESRVVINFNYF